MLLGIIITPGLLMFFLRSNPAIAFLSLCAGGMLSTYVNSDLATTIDKFNSGTTSGDLVTLGLIVVPLLLSIILLAHTLPNSKTFLKYLIPAICTGGLLALLVAPYLPGVTNISLVDNSLWLQLQKSQAVIVGVGALSSLVVIWITRPKHGHGGDKKKHK